MSSAARDQSTTKRTFADVASLDPERSAGELVRGEWVPVTRNTWKHGEIVDLLAGRLGESVRGDELHRAARCGFTIPDRRRLEHTGE